MDFDVNGWALGAIEPLAVETAHAVLSPEATGRIEVERWAHQAAKFFRIGELTVTPSKRYDVGFPLRDTATLVVGTMAEVEIVTLPVDNAPDVMACARAGVAAMGGAGFDALLARAKRVWQFRPAGGAQPQPVAALLCSAIVASVLLGPILAPDGAVFGVKTARERLAKLGWK